MRGRTSNRDGIGASVWVTTPDGITRLREQNGGSHTYSQNDDTLHFGLGRNSTISRLKIRWPSGIVEVYTNIRVDRFYMAIERGGIRPRFSSGQGKGSALPSILYLLLEDDQN